MADVCFPSREVTWPILSVHIFDELFTFSYTLTNYGAVPRARRAWLICHSRCGGICGRFTIFPHADLPRRASFLVQKMWVCLAVREGVAGLSVCEEWPCGVSSARGYTGDMWVVRPRPRQDVEKYPRRGATHKQTSTSAGQFLT